MAFELFDAFDGTVDSILEKASKEGRLKVNPSWSDLRAMAMEEPEVEVTPYGSLLALTEPTSRSKPFTLNNVDNGFGDGELELLEQAETLLGKGDVICLDVMVREGEAPVTARLVVPARQAHIAYGGLKLFGQRVEGASQPDYQVLFFFDPTFADNRDKALPDKDITIRVAFSPQGRMVKVVRNSSYVGEWKKGVFTGEDFKAKQGNDAIFLHAGCRSDHLEMVDGDLETRASLFVALSANGKTSLTCRVLARKANEESWLIQDDGGILRKDGSFLGFELGGLYVKTDGLKPSDQIETYYGVLKPNSYLENVHLEDGGLDFFNVQRTSNGRAVIERRDFMHCSPGVDVPKVHNLFLITRGNIIPAVAKVTPAQATALMVLGQSMESSAGDPTQAGAIKNVFFYDPFLAGDREEHAHLFYDILKKNPHINCYLLNTGGVGQGTHYRDITLDDTLNILDSIVRDSVKEWVASEATGLMVPKSVRRVDSVLFHPEKLFQADAFKVKQQALNDRRKEVLGQYPGLDRSVCNALN